MVRGAAGCAIVFALITGACQPRPPGSAYAPADSPVHTDPRLGFSLSIPHGWTAQPTDTLALLLLPTKSSSAADPVSAASLSLDVPRLPPHLPGMIRMSLVQNGFVKDLRERFGEVTVIDERPADVPDAQARMLLLSWRDDGQPFMQRAVLMIHAGRVYIFRGTSAAEDFATVDRAFGLVLRSLAWIET